MAERWSGCVGGDRQGLGGCVPPSARTGYHGTVSHRLAQGLWRPSFISFTAPPHTDTHAPYCRMPRWWSTWVHLVQCTRQRRPPGTRRSPSCRAKPSARRYKCSKRPPAAAPSNGPCVHFACFFANGLVCLCACVYAYVGTCTRRSPLALVLEPTRDLALQTLGELQRFAAHLPAPGLRQVALVGGQAPREYDGALAEGVDIVVGTVGKLAGPYPRAFSAANVANL
jgi:hypothetical protein